VPRSIATISGLDADADSMRDHRLRRRPHNREEM
jgi:hypothetical protein